MSIAKRQRALSTLIAQSGASSHRYLGFTGKERLQFEITAANGCVKRFAMSATAGDFRADRNNLSILRTFCRTNSNSATA